MYCVSQWLSLVGRSHQPVVFTLYGFSSVSGLHEISGLRYIFLKWLLGFPQSMVFIGQLVFSYIGIATFRFHQYWGFMNFQAVGNYQNLSLIALPYSSHQCSSAATKPLNPLMANASIFPLFCRLYCSTFLFRFL